MVDKIILTCSKSRQDESMQMFFEGRFRDRPHVRNTRMEIVPVLCYLIRNVIHKYRGLFDINHKLLAITLSNP